MTPLGPSSNDLKEASKLLQDLRAKLRSRLPGESDATLNLVIADVMACMLKSAAAARLGVN